MELNEVHVELKFCDNCSGIRCSAILYFGNSDFSRNLQIYIPLLLNSWAALLKLQISQTTPIYIVLSRGANMASTAYKAFMSAAQALPGFNTSNKPYAEVSYADLSAQGMPLNQQSYQPCTPNVSPKHEILFQRFRKVQR
jgi:hypothetical protein